MATRKRTTMVPADETPEARFKRVGTMRMNKALAAIGLLSNLTGSNYKSIPDQIEMMRSALQHQVDTTFNKLNGEKTMKGGFQL